MVDLDDDAGLVALGGVILFNQKPCDLRVVMPEVSCARIENALGDVVDVRFDSSPSLTCWYSDPLIGRRT